MGQTNEKLDNGFIPHDHLSVLSATNANEESTTVLEAPLMPHIFPNKILSCRIVVSATISTNSVVVPGKCAQR
jgi:hypothetical protein